MASQKILVVDDEADVRDIIKRLLSKVGYSVETAENGAEGWAAFERQPCDVVITDLHMPRMGGGELVRRIKEAAPRTVAIVLTGYGTLDSAVNALRSGCDDYLLKPVPSLNLLAHCIERCLARRDALTMAASSRKVSEAKDNILEIVVEDFHDRLAELQEHLGGLQEACAGNQPALRRVAAMTAAVAQVTAMLKDVKTIHQTLSERSVEAN